MNANQLQKSLNLFDAIYENGKQISGVDSLLQHWAWARKEDEFDEI